MWPFLITHRLSCLLCADLWPLGAANQEVDSVKRDWLVCGLWMIVYIIPYWRLDPCWPICGPICWEPWPASICNSTNYLWRASLCIGVVKWSPAVPWLKKDAARLLHAAASLSSRLNVKHIKLNVPANLTQLFVCCWGTRECVFSCMSGGPKWWLCMFSCLSILKHTGVLVGGAMEKATKGLPVQRWLHVA